MLHTKFRGNLPAGSEEEDFHFLVPEIFHKKFGSDRHSSF